MFSIKPHDMNPVLHKLHELCLGRKVTLASAESCTGGLISSLITMKSGSSAYFLGGVCAYSNAAKCKLLSVPAELIVQHGAVSGLVARLMAEGARQTFAADFAVSVTGIAGPGGGSSEKPLGTVFVSFSREGATDVEHLNLSGDRDSIRSQTCLFALSGLYDRILLHTGVVL